MKIVTVALKGAERPSVNFKGVWTKGDVDRAYRFMLNSLKEHIKRLKEAKTDSKES